VGPEVDDAITAARAWLAGAQEDDGSWGANANSTGLAAWALGDTPESVEAAQWLRDHQANDTDACTKIGAAGAGAVAFTQDSLTDARNDGITAGTAGEFQRATSQALVALGRVEAPATPAALALSGPTGYVQGGKAATFKVAGAVAGSRLCVTVGNNYKAGTANGSGALSLGVTLPASTATRTVTVVDANGSSATTTAKILGAKRLVVKPAVKRVRKGKKVRVTVTGLAAGEKVTLRYRGKVVATGTASAKGAFARVVKVGRKTGPAAIAATGQFAPRTGATTIRVVR
jgi:hypothetical protein